MANTVVAVQVEFELATLLPLLGPPGGRKRVKSYGTFDAMPPSAASGTLPALPAGMKVEPPETTPLVTEPGLESGPPQAKKRKRRPLDFLVFY